MAGEIKRLDFADGITISTITDLGVNSAGFAVYANPAAFVAAKGTAAAEGDAFYDSTDNVIKSYDGSNWNIGNRIVASATTTFPADSEDDVILCDATSAGFSVTLPAAATHTGKTYVIVKTDATNNRVTIDPNASETIDGLTTGYLDRRYQSIEIVCDGSEWHTRSGSVRVDSMVRMTGTTGHGSTNTVIRRFTTTTTNQGADITLAQSSTLGDTFTVNSDGIYYISYTDGRNGGVNAQWGISLNSSQLTTGINSITAADRLNYTSQTNLTPVPWSGFLSKDDVIRAHTDGACDNTGGIFTIAKIGRV